MGRNHDVEILRCREDNYAYLIHDAETGATVLIDAPESQALRDALAERGWKPTHILLTHHHFDHVDGVEDQREGAIVVGAEADAHRLPTLDQVVAPGDVVTVGQLEFHVLDAPGHTLGHIAYYLPQRDALFSGDSLMVHGCGRLFEGTAQDMFGTISAMSKLPEKTRVFSGHDYAEANLAFAATCGVDPVALENRQRDLHVLKQSGAPTVGVSLSDERSLNPYMRADLPATAEALGLVGAAPAEIFAEIRARKDQF